MFVLVALLLVAAANAEEAVADSGTHPTPPAFLLACVATAWFSLVGLGLLVGLARREKGRWRLVGARGVRATLVAVYDKVLDTCVPDLRFRDPETEAAFCEERKLRWVGVSTKGFFVLSLIAMHRCFYGLFKGAWGQTTYPWYICRTRLGN